MFERILVPLDGSLLAECVLPHTIAVAAAYDAEVVLLHVVEGGDGLTVMPADPLAWQMRKAEAKANLEMVRRRLDEAGIGVSAIIQEGMAARRIANYAEARNCDLLILSSHGRSGLEPWSAGSVAKKVMESAKTSLMLVRAFQEPRIEPAAYRRIMLPLDGSQRAEAALPPAITLARHWDAELLLVHTVTRPPRLRHTLSSVEGLALANQLVKHNLAEASDYLSQLRARLPVRSRVHLCAGDKVTTVLQEVAEHEKVDLVLASAHGHGSNHHQRFGSVMTETITYGAAPLLIVQDMQPEQIVATVAESLVRKSNDSIRWRPPQTVSWRAV